MAKTYNIAGERVSSLARKIAEKIEYTASAGKLQQKRATSSFSTVSVIFTPAHTDEKTEKEVPALYHTEFRAPNGKIISVRSRRDLEALVYLKESPRTLDALIEVGSAGLTLNPDVPASAEEEPADGSDYF